MKFKESELAHFYLDGMKGIEIGGSAHNPFGLNTINIDYTDKITTYKEEEIKLCGESLKVDVIAPGDELPFKDNSYDFVISSHVIEHFFDPIKALKEWRRVASKYIFIIAPHKDRMFDRDKPTTTLQTLIDRHSGKIKDTDPDDHSHHSVWDTQAFKELVEYLEFGIVNYQDADDKVGNGFTFLLKP